MPTSKANTNSNTLTKIELDAIPPSFSSGVLFCFPEQNAPYNPAEINSKSCRLRLIEIDSLIPEDHESYADQPGRDDIDGKENTVTAVSREQFRYGRNNTQNICRFQFRPD